MHRSLIILLLGQPGSGKTSVSEYLHKTYNFNVIRISDLIRIYAKEKNISLHTRQDYIATHTLLLKEKGEYFIVDEILRNKHSRICVDGIRVPAHIEKLQQHNALAIALLCSPAQRFQRTVSRSSKLDSNNLDGFTHEEMLEAQNNDPFVQNTKTALGKADIKIDTSVSFEDVKKSIDKIMAKVLS